MTWYDASFGSSKTGLATVGYLEYDDTGSVNVARTTTGVVEVGGGAYGVDVTLTAGTVGLLWDTGEATPKFANESLVDSINIAAILAGGGGGSGLTLEEYLALRGY